MMKLAVTNLIFCLLFARPAFTETSHCAACDLVENSGDEALPQLEKMTLQELSRRDSRGRTPFFWSVFYGQSKTRDFLVSVLKKEDLLSKESALQLYNDCANNQTCRLEDLKFLHQLGFAIGSDAVSTAVTGTQECSIPKFKSLIELGASMTETDSKGFNLLHQIVDRSRVGKPIFSRDCLVAAIKIARQKHPELLKQKNREGLTPVQLSKFYRSHQNELGTGIKAGDLDLISHAFL